MKINIPIKKGISLCAEDNSSSGYREICVGLVKDGVWVQDLAVIGQNYHFEDGDFPVFDEGFFVKVFADCNNEDFTDEYIISEYKDSSAPEWKDFEDGSGSLYVDGKPVASYDLVTGEICIDNVWYTTNDWLTVSVEKVHEFVERKRYENNENDI